ncbi:DNA methyltransferase [Thermomonas haemolytica]|uniref:site-specific DNA-methyltransferase (adenine-specific) n=1 Tax=Thermomonas haemolytica TaxID=141949 RepID=A0A4V2V1M8_9GAMM|nr:DNA methyltransferase [Thermomonas haemolytica]TCT21812.1 type II restriction/modification system DNA methylase subunit YeeA [Thermomonas haemolytica]TNY28268.1 SAM-dependent methyltransferase [Thermomonas haemolytica]
MPLSLNEIRERARAFAREWAGETSERAEAQSFWNEFFNVFGVNRRRVAVFEQKAARFSGSQHGRIDVFWPGVMLAEHKSEGRDLDAAFEQATDYFAGLKDAELPRFVLVSDFQRFRLHDLETGERTDFPLAELHKQIGRFGFISGYQSRSYKEEDPVNVQAAERMGKLHDALKAAGYDGHALELLLVRLLFCLFADDTGIFPRQSFHELIAQRTSEDGADLGLWVGRIFQVLNTPPEKRQTTLDEQLAELPYVNGKLFEETLPLADFNAQMRGLLLDASLLDWSRISPAIFGAMFQSVMDAKARRNLGAHYTSEKNILKLIGPLFLDELKAELDKAGHDEKKLAQLHRRLATLTFLDPACGCGNFLVIAYRELRALELEILKRQFATQQSVLAHVQDHVLVDVDQFYGIEIEEFPAQIAQVAMWLMDHQMNLRVSEQFGENVVRLPLKKSATIVHGNALRMDWNDVVPAEKLHYILGNPPFVGKKEQNAEQKADMAAVFAGVKGAGVLDFVCAWYLKAAQYIDGHPVRVAFVSTNSITQGEQVGILWAELYRRGMHIQFAHRTFKWSNEARGNAAVHCVIIGFGAEPLRAASLYDYERVDGEPQLLDAERINPYLVDAPEVFLMKRGAPLCATAPAMNYGSMPIDDGHLILSDDEYRQALADEPAIAPWIRPYFGGDEFINAGARWCLWLVDAPPAAIKQSPFLRARIEACRAFRAGSGRATTRELAKTPGLFGEIRQPASRYLLLPKVSSENRAYIPCGFLSPDAIASGTSLVVAGAGLYDFGVITSQMHMAWMRAVAGRLESRYQYSAGIVYNNFPWPELGDDDKHHAAIAAAAQAVLDARAQFPDATLADLYDPLTMPPALVKAHAALDKAVDAAYIAAEKAAGRKPPKLSTDAERVAFLFQRYQALTSLLPAAKPKKPRKTKGAA